MTISLLSRSAIDFSMLSLWKIKRCSLFSIDEILRLSKETGCSYCIDFAHLKARNNGKIDYKWIVKKLPKKFHIHFSGIEFTSKGERNHILTEESEIKELLMALKGRDVTIINESPNPLGDSLKTKKILDSL